MNPRFEFATASRILFGPGTLDEIGSIAASLGKHALIVCGEGGANPEILFEKLNRQDIPYDVLRIRGEPTIETIETGIASVHELACDLLIGYGGGSALDTAKAVGGLAKHPEPVIDYLEVIGKGKSLPGPGMPVIAVPTTAGTGAEVTRNAVIASPEHHYKASLRSPYLFPTIALVDPNLTLSLPAEGTASTGMDALTQLIEPFVSIRANVMVDAICREGIPLAARALPKVYHDPEDRKARESMSLAATFSGIALTNAGLGAVHGFASPLAGMYGAAHGQICARLLAPVTQENVMALQARDRGSEHLRRYQEVARMVTGEPEATLEDGIDWLELITQELHIPSLNEMGMQQKDIPEIVSKALTASSMKANPIRLSPEELTRILQLAY